MSPTGSRRASSPPRRIVVGQNIRRTREFQGLTQQELADRLRMHRHHLSDYENGKHEPSEARMHEIAEQLGVHWTHFYLEVIDLGGDGAAV